jgi:hypothetical protein
VTAQALYGDLLSNFSATSAPNGPEWIRRVLGATSAGDKRSAATSLQSTMVLKFRIAGARRSLPLPERTASLAPAFGAPREHRLHLAAPFENPKIIFSDYRALKSFH